MRALAAVLVLVVAAGSAWGRIVRPQDNICNSFISQCAFEFGLPEDTVEAFHLYVHPSFRPSMEVFIRKDLDGHWYVNVASEHHWYESDRDERLWRGAGRERLVDSQKMEAIFAWANREEAWLSTWEDDVELFQIDGASATVEWRMADKHRVAYIDGTSAPFDEILISFIEADPWADRFGRFDLSMPDYLRPGTEE